MAKPKTFENTRLTKHDKDRMSLWAKDMVSQAKDPETPEVFVQPRCYNLHNPVLWGLWQDAWLALAKELTVLLDTQYPHEDMLVLEKYKQTDKGGQVSLRIPCTDVVAVQEELGDERKWGGTTFSVSAPRLFPRKSGAYMFEGYPLMLPENDPCAIIQKWVANAYARHAYITSHEELRSAFVSVVLGAQHWRDILVVLPEQRCKELFVQPCATPEVMEEKSLAAALQSLFAE